MQRAEDYARWTTILSQMKEEVKHQNNGEYGHGTSVLLYHLEEARKKAAEIRDKISDRAKAASA
jgi:hypothetical protein